MNKLTGYISVSLHFFPVHLIEIKFHQPDTMILLVLHINRNAVVVLLGCSTSGLVSDLSPAYEDQISQLTFQQFFKEKK
jgi:hypothetical protein